MFIVSGASGNTGRFVVTRLLQAGKKVRALVRSADKAKGLEQQGAEVVTLDLADAAALRPALSGASGLYLLSPPDMAAKDFLKERAAWFDSVAAVIKAAEVPHVVLLSSVAAHLPTGTGIIQSLHAGEQALKATGVPSTFVRASYFVENWAAVLPVAKQDGVLPSFIPGDLRVPMVSTPDIGQLAAEALLEGPRGVRALELGGPRDVTPREVAAVVATILSKPVRLVEPPLDAVVPTFTSFGISPNIATLYRDMYEGISSGKVGWEGGSAEQRRGGTPLEATLRQLLQ